MAKFFPKTNNHRHGHNLSTRCYPNNGYELGILNFTTKHGDVLLKEIN